MKKSFFKQFKEEFGTSGVVFSLLLVLILGGFGGVLVERMILPYFSTWPIIRNFSVLQPDSPILITKREEIRIIDSVNQAEIVSRAKNSIVTIYQHQGEFDSGNFRIDKAFTGIVVTNDGIILAPLINVNKGLLLTSVLTDGSVKEAKVIGEDSFTGLAVLKIDTEGAPVLREGFSENIKAGERLIALRAEENSLQPSSVRVEANSSGVVKPSLVTVYSLGELNTELNVAWPENFRAAGTVLVNSEGELMGIDSVISGEAKTVRGEDIKSLIDNYLDDDNISWPQVPLEYQVLGKQQTSLFGLSREYGVLIKSRYSELRVDDFVYSVDGTTLSERDGLQETLFSKSIGSQVKMKLIRDGVEKEVEIEL